MSAATKRDDYRRDGREARVDFSAPCPTAHCLNCAQADLLQQQIRDMGRELRTLRMRGGSVEFARMRWALAMLLRAAKAGETPAPKVFRRADEALARAYGTAPRASDLRFSSDPSGGEHGARSC